MEKTSFALGELHGKRIGVVGGMGPIASARFLSWFYRPSEGESLGREQALPSVLLVSDPTMPDRTERFLRGDVDEIVERTESACQYLLEGGAERLVLCCFTLHHIVDRLSGEVRERSVCLPDLGLAMVLDAGRRTLILCTKGTTKLRVFERSSRWRAASDLICFPDEKDQSRIHEMIYDLKNGGAEESVSAEVEELAKKYAVDDLLVGCTEFHLLSDPGARRSKDSPRILDPLLSIAKAVRSPDLVQNASVFRAGAKFPDK